MVLHFHSRGVRLGFVPARPKDLVSRKAEKEKDQDARAEERWDAGMR